MKAEVDEDFDDSGNGGVDEEFDDAYHYNDYEAMSYYNEEEAYAYEAFQGYCSEVCDALGLVDQYEDLNLVDDTCYDSYEEYG